jgi:hypothetical protein
LLPWIAYTEELDIAANVMIPARAAISIIDIFFFHCSEKYWELYNINWVDLLNNFIWDKSKKLLARLVMVGSAKSASNPVLSL